MFAIALAQYKKALNDRSLLDFSDVLQRAVDLLGRMDEFSQSRYRLEGRYHHVLVDEFQDTSRKQWELISLLVKAWGEGAGARRPSRRSSSSAIASSRSTASATPRSRCCRKPARSSTRCARARPRPPLDRAQLPRRARSCSRSSTISSPRWARTPAGPTTSSTTRTTDFPSRHSEAAQRRARIRVLGRRHRRRFR